MAQTFNAQQVLYFNTVQHYNYVKLTYDDINNIH